MVVKDYQGGLVIGDNAIKPKLSLLYHYVKKSNLTEKTKTPYNVISRNVDMLTNFEYDIGDFEEVKHGYVLTVNVPFKVRQYNLPSRMYPAVIDHLTQMVDNGR